MAHESVTAGWWRSALQEKLSQGDVIDSIPFATTFDPPQQVKKTDLSGKRTAYVETPIEQQAQKSVFLFHGKMLRGLIVSPSCDLDKEQSYGKVLVAPIREITVLDDKAREAVLGQRKRSHMPLPDIPGIGSCYADLRGISLLERSLVEGKRLASMTDEAELRFKAHLVVFFARLSLEHVMNALQATAVDD